VAPGAIPLVLGERWTPCTPLVQLLAIVAIVRTINIPIGPLVLAVGRAGRLFGWTLGYATVQTPIYAAFLMMGGLVPATLFMVAAHLAAVLVIYFYLVQPVLGPVFADHARAFVPATGLAMAMAVAVHFLPATAFDSTVSLVAVQVAVGVVIYVGATILFR